MASNYQKLNIKLFNERLAGNQYESVTGARRAVGKSEMTDDEKAKAYKAINKHFDVESEPKTGGSTKTKGAGPAKRGAATKPTTAAKTAVKGAPKARAAGRGKRTGGAKKTSARANKSAPAEGAPAASELAELHAGAQATREALIGLTAAQEIDPSLDVKGAAARGAAILQHSIDRIGALLGTAAPIEPSTTPFTSMAEVVEDTNQPQS